MKTLLGINLYQFSNFDIGQTKLPYSYKHLPEYCLDILYGTIKRTEFYHQFTSPEIYNKDIGEEKNWCFDAINICSVLQEEIDGDGLDGVLSNIDLRPVFEKLKYVPSHKYMRNIPIAQYLVIDINYYGSDDDYGCDIKLVGYLNSELEIILFEK